MGRRRAAALPATELEPMPAHAMKGVWRDPDDVTPGARRTPREVTGFRTFCPLRRMLVHRNSGITAEMIMAADKLRELVDVVTWGYSAERPLIYVALNAQPRFGLGPAAQAEMAAVRIVRRALALFDATELAVLEAIVLRNQSIRGWLDSLAEPPSPLLVKQCLLSILERLAQHFAADVDDELARGRRLPL